MTRYVFYSLPVHFWAISNMRTVAAADRTVTEMLTNRFPSNFFLRRYVVGPHLWGRTGRRDMCPPGSVKLQGRHTTCRPSWAHGLPAFSPSLLRCVNFGWCCRSPMVPLSAFANPPPSPTSQGRPTPSLGVLRASRGRRAIDIRDKLKLMSFYFPHTVIKAPARSARRRSRTPPA